MDDRYEPRTIDVDKANGVTITFLDGFVATFDLPTLRRGCPCATCRSRREQGLPAWTESPELRIQAAELHGAWGLNITWNDGHSTGIYPFEALRRWSQDDTPIRPDSGPDA